MGMAKKMHPDKNGGTEDAKHRFQIMKEKYENLKNRLQPQQNEREDSDVEVDKEPERETDDKSVEADDDGKCSESEQANEHESEKTSEKQCKKTEDKGDSDRNGTETQ